MANKNFHFNSFTSRSELVDKLSAKIIIALISGINARGYATLVLSGGSTPLKLLQKLSNTGLDWEKVRVTLVDERWVDTTSDKSNEKLVRD
ncbi:MAG: 6-phosphogluconolactonase, partial [Campylobacterota bacterium]|nr:6-phosphogluconolactonase [Campylobacterota bacterium]